MADDCCSTCGKDYDFRPAVDWLAVYIAAHSYNHVRATCPHCGGTTTIFSDPDQVVHHAKKLPVRLFSAVHESIVAQFDKVFGAGFTEPEPLWLSPRTERYVSYFRDQLERGVME